jgi:hypothetical protein
MSFRNRDLREHVAQLLTLAPGGVGQGRMTYDLRRLRLHGFIERIARSHRYRVTDFGFRAAILLTRSYARVVRSGLAVLQEPTPPAPSRLRTALEAAEDAIDRLWRDAA